MKNFIRAPPLSTISELAVYIAHRVRQQDCDDDTTPLNRRNNLCLRSPQKLKFSGTPRSKTS